MMCTIEIVKSIPAAKHVSKLKNLPLQQPVFLSLTAFKYGKKTKQPESKIKMHMMILTVWRVPLSDDASPSS